jgi:thiamine-phosphate pyrophosphorylase
MKLIVISAPHPVARESELVRGMIQEGLSHFHLRRPSWSVQELEACILKYTRQERRNLVLHSHHDLVLKLGLKVGAFQGSVY